VVVGHAGHTAVDQHLLGDLGHLGPAEQSAERIPLSKKAA
jgi:hypothetical protein